MEVIEFLDNTGTVIAKRMPENGSLEIKWGSQLTVRESQDAVFFRDGKALDVFGAGRHVLQTQNIPKIGKWVTSFGYGENSPFRAEVVFVGKQLFTNLKWGTTEPIIFRDTELQIVRLRSYGSFSVQVSDTLVFLNKIVGTNGTFTVKSFEDYLRGIIISKLNTIISRLLSSVLDIAGKIEDINLIMRTELFNDFNGLGLQLHDFYIQSISVPEDVQKMIDTRSGIGVVGNLDDLMKYRVANSIGGNSGGSGNLGEGLATGAGLAMGMNMAKMINEGMNSNQNDEIVNKIKQLKELLDLGAISQEEFEKKKQDYLKKL